MTALIPLLMVAAAALLTSSLAAAQLPSEQFAIERFKIEGNTLIGAGEVEALLKPFTGKNRAVDDLRQASEALRQLYRRKGYSVVQVVVPEQDLDQGVVTLQVIEARIGRVTVSGNRFFDQENIRASLPMLAEDSSPRAGDISANVQLANENPAKQVDLVLRPGNTPDRIDAEIDVIDVDPLKAFITLDNTGTRQTGDYRLGVGVQHANLFGRDHVATANYVTSPGKENLVRLYSGSYRLPLYSSGNSVDFIAARSEVDAGTTQTVAGDLNFSGRGSVYGGRFNQLLQRRGEYSHRLVYGIDYRAYQNDCTLGLFGVAGCGPAAADVTVRPVSITYGGNWSTPGQIADFNIGVTKNMPGAAHGRAVDFNAVRPSPNGGEGAPANYRTYRIAASIVNAFEGNWQVRAAAGAQYSADALVSGEQFGISGANAVRGFREREVARDKGYFLNFELYSPYLPAKLLPGDGNLRGLLFHDLGRAANNRLDGEVSQSAAIASIGAGLRWNMKRNFNLRFDLARGIENQGSSKQTVSTHGHLSVYLGF